MLNFQILFSYMMRKIRDENVLEKRILYDDWFGNLNMFKPFKHFGVF